MKYCFCSTIVFLILISCPIYPQEVGNRKYEQNVPVLIRPTSHDPNFKNFPEKSFYKSRNNWQAIIDSTWGPGLPLANKLNIFNTYADALNDEFDGFLSLGMNWVDWDNLRNNYFMQINDSTSRGRFCALMNYFTNELKDAHTSARDNGVLYSPLNPGIPILFAGSVLSVEHFGAAVTVLPDSSVLVLRTLSNHPLGLQPGDIILGYEGIPYKVLISELLQAKLPGVLPWPGAESARAHQLFLGAGMNWHLFDTIDILQHSTGDTLHLPVAPMINLNVPPMLNNEQVEIPGIPFPDYFNDQWVSYGILNNINIGYIYLFSERQQANPDQQFYYAVNALKNTEGLIIDMRWNEGGWALFDQAFDILFNDFSLTIEDAYRSSPTTFSLSPSGNASVFQIDGDPNSLYDRPIAILLGPTCVSMGDLTAQRFRYHPTVKFFGKPPAASLGDNILITNFSDWFLLYSISDMFHVNNPGNYLNRKEFPIDYPVWHNPDDAANGIDAVVEEALNWMNNLVYGHDLTINKRWYSPSVDTLHITATVENPQSHLISSSVYIVNLDSSLIDSVSLHPVIANPDNEIWGGTYIAPVLEDEYNISLSAYDSTENEGFTIPNINRFTTVGPLVFESYQVQLISQLINGYRAYVNLSIRNAGISAAAGQVEVELVSDDSSIISIGNSRQLFGEIPAGQTQNSPNSYIVRADNNPLIDTLQLKLNIYSAGNLYWKDSTVTVIVGLENFTNSIPVEYKLKQNYPNPFNPTTTIEFDLPKTNEVTLKIFNVLGEEVATLVSDRLSAGSYSYEWDAGGLANGVYMYRLQAGNYIETRKMVLMK